MRTRALVCCLLTACATPSPQSDAGPLAHDGGAEPPDASVQDASVVDAGLEPEPDAGPPLTQNLLVLAASVSAQSATSLTFAALAADAGERCFVEPHGACLVIDCAGTTADSWLSAGVVQLRAGDGGVLAEVVFDGGYDTDNRAGARWVAGDQLTVSASGGDVPRFRAELRVAPRVTAVDLVTDDGGAVVVSHLRDFVVHWVAVDAGVGVVITQLAAGGVSQWQRVLCDFEGEAAVGVVPASALSVFHDGPVVISVGGAAVETLSPGGYRVRVQVMTSTPFRSQVVDAP